ncbi:uncharacterized protein LOC110432960 isoform X2 [Sorghum bicolor]|uniref:uncharacterized protein LOC110432960 isoform X2 n=1 Tax=Sorghum bicolor TaxID=4558 RepID=UPI00081AB5DF|nr:uncharacterized protein LOC110432960 isoform X2 [Sorghum bicolor]|eukprot:XP_021309981.1 uncharacterized protein LOC110432960 isoform X2 [Sorghum bicolor]
MKDPHARHDRDLLVTMQNPRPRSVVSSMKQQMVEELLLWVEELLLWVEELEQMASSEHTGCRIPFKDISNTNNESGPMTSNLQPDDSSSKLKEGEHYMLVNGVGTNAGLRI